VFGSGFGVDVYDGALGVGRYLGVNVWEWANVLHLSEATRRRWWCAVRGCECVLRRTSCRVNTPQRPASRRRTSDRTRTSSLQPVKKVTVELLADKEQLRIEVP